MCKLPRNRVKNVAIISTALVSLRWIHLYILHHAKDAAIRLKASASGSKCFQMFQSNPTCLPRLPPTLYRLYHILFFLSNLEFAHWNPTHGARIFGSWMYWNCTLTNWLMPAKLSMIFELLPQILTFQMKLKSECRISTQTPKLSSFRFTDH